VRHHLTRPQLLAFLILVLMLPVVLLGCGSEARHVQEKTVRVGFMPGPYSDLFRRGIQPILEKQGYHVLTVEFTHSTEPNEALIQGAIDANVFQHKDYLTSYNEQNQTELTELCTVPTAPLGIYSGKHTSIGALSDGASIAIPNDPANLGRALVLLQQAGILTLDEKIDPLTATEKDIAANLKQVRLLAMNAAQLPSALSDKDFAVIPGTQALAAGMRLSQSVLLERPPRAYQLIAAVKTADAGKPFAADLASAYRSETFRKFIETDELAKGFSLPDEESYAGLNPSGG